MENAGEMVRRLDLETWGIEEPMIVFAIAFYVQCGVDRGRIVQGGVGGLTGVVSGYAAAVNVEVIGSLKGVR